MSPAAGCTLVAIARNEAKYILEWMAHHLAIGFRKIIVYDNGSTDETAAILASAGRNDPRITAVTWPAVDGVSPQRSAYNHALTLVDTPWVAYFDIDEFLVPWRHGSVDAFVASLPDDVSAVHINWRCFGSSGRSDPDYALVTEAFTRCADRAWVNNHHYKTIARTDRVEEAFIHYVTVKSGRRALSDLRTVPSESHGLSDAVVHDGVQINHYQCKTQVEFARRMSQGDANYPDRHPSKSRDGGDARFAEIDRNEDSDDRIAPYRAAIVEGMQGLSRESRPRTLLEGLVPRRMTSAAAPR